MKTEELESRIKQGSTNIDEHLLLGDLYLTSGQFDKLIALYDQTLNLPLSNLNKARIRYEMGEALQYSNKPKEAIESFTSSIRAIKSNKCEEWESLYIEGISYYNLYLLSSDLNKINDFLSKAETIFIKLSENYPDHDDVHIVYSNLADIQTRNEKYDEALHFYNFALQKCSDNHSKIQYLSGIASAYGRKEQYSEAIRYFNKAINQMDASINPTKVYYDMGLIYFQQNLLMEAEDALKKAKQFKNSHPILKRDKEYAADILWHLGTIAYERGQSRDDVVVNFMALLQLINANHFYYTSCHLTLGHFYFMIKIFGKAREHYNEVLKSPNSDEEDIKLAKESLSKLPLDA